MITRLRPQGRWCLLLRCRRLGGSLSGGNRHRCIHCLGYFELEEMPEKQLGIWVWAWSHKCRNFQPRDGEGGCDSKHLCVQIGETRPWAPRN